MWCVRLCVCVRLSMSFKERARVFVFKSVCWKEEYACLCVCVCLFVHRNDINKNVGGRVCQRMNGCLCAGKTNGMQ